MKVVRDKWKNLGAYYAREAGKLVIPRSGAAGGEPVSTSWPSSRKCIF
jgi:hypothetical protein